MKILVVNAGSSSLKYQLFDMNENKVLAKGNCERIGIDGMFTYKPTGKNDYKTEAPLPDHKAAIALVLKTLCDSELGVISDISEIKAVGHRFAHGGERLRRSTVLGDEEIKYLESIAELNPLHGPPAISGVIACKAVLPDVKHVGVFDTSYYSDMTEEVYVYPIPYEYYEKYKIRKYGFHGTSHRYVAGEAQKMLNNPDAKIISCHLGNGSSITATAYGKARDTSMGFTPQDGVPMGTRSGAIDPTVATYIMKKEGLTAEEVEKVLNSKSGLLGISGVSSDSRDVSAAIAAGNERAILAYKILSTSVKKLIGAYMAELNGADAIVFTAGIGENDSALREMICESLDGLGIILDTEKNRSCPRGEACDVSKDGSSVRIFVIPTNEEYMIALDTKALAEA